MKVIKSFILAICLASIAHSISAQTLVDSGSLYKSKGGLQVSYATHFLGTEPCGKKYRVTVSIKNGESFKANIGGSVVDLDDDYDQWEQNYSACSKDARLMFGYYPGYESWKLIDAGFSDSNSHVIYMKSQSKYPNVSASIVARPAG